MKTENSMQLKAKINNRAKAANVSPQLMLQNNMLERLIDRISRSPWRDCIIVKGGMLIGSLIGIERRTTKDLDTTVRGFTLTHETAQQVFSDICAIPVDDDLEFEFLRTENIREIDDYPGIRVFIKARYEPLAVPLTVDVTTGDKITPGAVAYEYPFVFDEGSAAIMAYPIETVLSEKLEAVFTRNVATTRIRDFYDIFELWRLKGANCDTGILKEALEATCGKRNSHMIFSMHTELAEMMNQDGGLAHQWDQYVAKHSYARGIEFRETVDTAEAILSALD